MARADAGRRLDAIVGEWLSAELGGPLARSAVRRLIMAGAVSLDGRVLRAPGRAVEAGRVVRAVVRPDLVRPPDPRAPLEPERVLYEDDVLIVVDKPAGLPTVATADPRRPHLVGLVEAWLARGEPGGRPYVGVHQRLDVETSGAVLFAKTREGNAGLAAQFAAHAVEKTYVALTVCPRRPPPSSWREEGAVAAESQAARSAVTDFRLLEAHPRGLLVEARPRTGRKHQVRIHLAARGLPILGDTAYGAPARSAPRVMLHARRLELRHPVSGAAMRVESPLPADFRAALDRLRGGLRSGTGPR